MAPAYDSGRNKFIPQPGDSDEVYEARAILKEKGNKYLIDWDGVDEEGQPYKPSWEPKCNAMPALKEAWEEEKRLKKLKAKLRKSGGTVKSRSMARSSTSTSRGRTKSRSVVDDEDEEGSAKSESEHEPAPKPRKRRKISREEGEDGDEESIATRDEVPKKLSKKRVLKRPTSSSRADSESDESPRRRKVPRTITSVAKANPVKHENGQTPNRDKGKGRMPAIEEESPPAQIFHVALDKVGPPKRKRILRNDYGARNDPQAASSSKIAEPTHKRPVPKRTSPSPSPPSPSPIYKLPRGTQKPGPHPKPPSLRRSSTPPATSVEHASPANDEQHILPEHQTLRSDALKSLPHPERHRNTPPEHSPLVQADLTPHDVDVEDSSPRVVPPPIRKEQNGERVALPIRKFGVLPRASPRVFRELARGRSPPTQDSIEQFSSPERGGRFSRRRVSESMIVPSTQDIDHAPANSQEQVIEEMEQAYVDFDPQPPPLGDSLVEAQRRSVPFPPTASTQQADVDSQSQVNMSLNGDPDTQHSPSQLHGVDRRILQEKDALIVELKGRNNSQDLLLAQLRLEKDELHKKLSGLAEKDKSARTKDQLIITLQAKNHELTQKLSRISVLEEEAHTKDQLLATIQAEKDELEIEKRVDITALQEILAVKEALIASLQQEKVELEERCRTCDDKLRTAERTVTELRAAFDGARTEGRATMQGFYAARIKQLEEDNSRWSARYEIIRKRDELMKGDEIRRRAAEAVELKAVNDTLEKEVVRLEKEAERVKRLEDMLAEVYFFVCQYVEDGKHCHERFPTEEAVRQHAYAVHYRCFEDD
ncbi:hypothetical protein BXZ70DRAFT_949074 [Cristinia sonorae]|uniref:Chromo domain-containing protein n=1 Tax=Cristinia sonorae TaxID=1940300 RepID=A0A8K0UJY1_9AGAR|nr:hypothetical protein BXZ70DRAFT_949074 [Cristinia sonorae]